jgi:hypothetical protein
MLFLAADQILAFMATGKTCNDEAAQRHQERYMTKIIYEVVEHDGGWAYQVDGVFSETFPSHDLAREAADRAAIKRAANLGAVNAGEASKAELAAVSGLVAPRPMIS